MDSSIIPLKHKLLELSLVETVDFFYPLVDDPYTMGKIAFANVVSDVYAVGVVLIDQITIILSTSTEFTEKERDVVVPLMIKGFMDSAKLAGCQVKINNIAVNPWCIIGGVATSVCTKDEIIMPSNSKSGDLLILTKPLGTQLATNAYIWMMDKTDNWKKISDIVQEDDIDVMYKQAIESMIRLNKDCSILMHKYNANAATDITGFGLYGHATNLVEFQTENVSFIIHTLPIIKNIVKIAKHINHDKKLLSGGAVETSGGLLISLPADNAKKFCTDYQNVYGHEAWIVGYVETGNRTVNIIDNPNIINV